MIENIQAEFTQTLRKTCKNLYLRALKPMTRQQGKHPMNKLHLHFPNRLNIQWQKNRLKHQDNIKGRKNRSETKLRAEGVAK